MPAAVLGADNGTKRKLSAKTQKELHEKVSMLSLCDRQFDVDFKGGATYVRTQKRTSSNSAVTKNVARHNNDGTSKSFAAAASIRADEIQINLREEYEKAYDIPRLDELQSLRPSEAEDARKRIRLEISKAFNEDLVSYFTGLTAKDVYAPDDNGKGGSITEETVGTDGTYFVSRVAPYGLTKAATDSATPMMDIIDDFVLYAKRNNLIDGVSMYGEIPATLYMVFPPELIQLHLLKELEEKNVEIEELSKDILQRNAAFSAASYSARLGLQNLTILGINDLKVPTGTDDWVIFGGYTDAVAAGMGPTHSWDFPPGMNQLSDGHLIRQKMAPYYQCLNGKGLRRYIVKAD